MKLSDIISRVQLETNETANQTYATTANIVSIGNTGQMEIANRTKDRIISNVPNSNADSSLTTTSGVRLYARPTNMLDFTKVIVGPYEIFPANINELQKMYGFYWWKFPGVPARYYFEDLTVASVVTPGFGIWPMPSSTLPIAIWGVRKPTDFAAGSLTFECELDARLHMALVYYICKELLSMRREPVMASEFERKMEDEILKYAIHSNDTTEKYQFLRDPVSTD